MKGGVSKTYISNDTKHGNLDGGIRVYELGLYRWIGFIPQGDIHTFSPRLRQLETSCFRVWWLITVYWFRLKRRKKEPSKFRSVCLPSLYLLLAVSLSSVHVLVFRRLGYSSICVSSSSVCRPSLVSPRFILLRPFLLYFRPLILVVVQSNGPLHLSGLTELYALGDTMGLPLFTGRSCDSPTLRRLPWKTIRNMFT